MTELLTKEKQFLKLNEELDRMAITGLAGHEMAAKTDNKFNTYQKAKGVSTLLRKQGAGDGILEIPGAANTNKLTTHKAVGGETYRSYTARNCEIPTAIAQSLQYRPKPTKYNECNRPQTYNRTSNSRVVPSNNSTFTIKYHNPKFLESPSLEVLVKEESSSLRAQPEAARIGNFNSATNEEATVRRSQTSTHTVACKKNISSEGLIKFLKSKIVILEEDHERISQEMSKQKEFLDKALEHTSTLQQQRDQAKNKNDSLMQQLARTEKQLEEANKHLRERSIEQNSIQKELETTKRELKLLMQTNSNLEKRLFKANEDLQSARHTLSLMKTSEREQRDTARKESDNKDTQIKNLKKQRANLLNAYKKQTFLIDNLKRQNVLLEQAKMLDFGEKEFAKVLDWNFKS